MAEKQKLSESDTIILSLHERWWKKMLAGEKILEIRKTAPTKKDREYRVLVYVTGGGGVCGEFICTDFMKIKMLPQLLETHKKQSCLTENQIREYAGESKRNLWRWPVTEVKEYYNPHPLNLYGLKNPPQSWCYYRGEEVPDIMTINNLANTCGYFFNAELDPELMCHGVNNGYNCRHPEQEENCGGIGCCYQWSCPLANVVPADEEDCEKYGLDYEESEFVLVYQKGQ